MQLVKGFPAEAVGQGGALELIQLAINLWVTYASDPLVVEVREERCGQGEGVEEMEMIELIN